MWYRECWKAAVLPFPDEDVEIRPDGLIYLPHERLRTRLNEAFGPGFYRLIELSEPKAGQKEIIQRWRMETRDGWCDSTTGHAIYYQNSPTASYGDACETAKSDAFVRLCKSAGIGLQVWNRDYQIMWTQKHAVQVPMLNGGKMQWRRKDRPPLQGERVSERQQGADYVPRETLDQANRKHFDSLKPKRGSAWDDSSLDSLTRDEHFAPMEDESDARRLHEMEEAVFADDSRE